MARPSDVSVGVGLIIARRSPEATGPADIEVLLMRRAGSHAAGVWAVPGGWVDADDRHPIDTVRREAVEEVNVSIRHAKLVGVTSEDFVDFRSVTLYYLACAWNGEWQGEPKICEPHKCTELMWHPVRKRIPQPAFPGLRDGVDYAVQAVLA